MCGCVCVCIYIYIHMCMHVFSCAWTCTCVEMSVFVSVCVHACMCTETFVHMCVCVWVCACMCFLLLHRKTFEHYFFSCWQLCRMLIMSLEDWCQAFKIWRCLTVSTFCLFLIMVNILWLQWERVAPKYFNLLWVVFLIVMLLLPPAPHLLDKGIHNIAMSTIVKNIVYFYNISGTIYSCRSLKPLKFVTWQKPDIQINNKVDLYSTLPHHQWQA